AAHCKARSGYGLAGSVERLAGGTEYFKAVTVLREAVEVFRANRLPYGRGSEIKLCAQLDLSGTDGCRSPNPSEGRAGDSRGRKVEGRMIGQIRNVGSQLEPVSLGDMD